MKWAVGHWVRKEYVLVVGREMAVDESWGRFYGGGGGRWAFTVWKEFQQVELESVMVGETEGTFWTEKHL